jgi:GNAT superfamily N-acetyltransferase
VDELERISEAAYLSVYGERVALAGGARCLRAPEAPESPMLNRVVGLGLGRPATDADVGEALAAMGDTACYVAISPSAAPTDLAARLDARGLEPGWGWMLFRRSPVPAPPVPTSLRLVEVGTGERDAWARVVVTAYGLPEAIVPFTASVTDAPGWACWLALDGDEPAAAGALWVDGEVAYFGFAGTLPEHRGKGGQGALFAARIARAIEHGCTTLVTETGEQLPGRPSSSYRNITRFGFEPQHVVAHRLRPRPAG